MRTLTLLIPGLLGVASFEHTPDVPALARLFRFGTIAPSPSAFSETIFRLFGFPATPDDRPVAAATYLVDDGDAHDGIWMRADPVHLRAERDAVVLLDDTSFHLERHEALLFVAGLQEIFAEQSIELQVPANHYRWYLKLKDRLRIKTVPIHDTVGDDIRRHRCGGRDRMVWERLVTAVQMSLHDSPVNHAREARGELPINGVWMWGMGSLPSPVSPPVWSRVFGDDATAQGLAIHCRIPHDELPTDAAAVIEQTTADERVLVVITFGLRHTQYLDQTGWQDFIRYLDSEWFAALWRLIKCGELHELTVLTGLYKLTIGPSSLMKIWRRRRSLAAYR